MRNPLPAVARVLGRRRSLMKLAEGIVWADTRLHRASRGRASLVGIAGLPSLRLTTTGRRTGQARENNLLYMPDRQAPADEARGDEPAGTEAGGGEVFVVTGSNWGRAHDPAWALNLRACPDARVLVHGRDIPVRARELTGLDRDAMWRRLLAFWPGYGMEREQAGRAFPIFVLTPVVDRSR
ncbi:nitroreductase/quinone reductase family protein [Prauserella alba]|nr:nitroreductase/quinone reductase family protein [Prauserella alba]